MNACITLNQEPFTNFVTLLGKRAEELSEKPALGFLVDGQADEVWRTFAQLDVEARAIAAVLQSSGLAGRAALLMYGPGLEFVAALLGCFYAGVLAVPVCLPRPRRSFERLEGIALDCGAAVALTAGALLPSLRGRASSHRSLDQAQWITTDDIDPGTAADWEEFRPTPDSTACIQYTSGSAADPKGVILTHGNLLFNSQLIHDAFGHGPDSAGLIWLPHYHDMGLIGGILQPLFGGFSTLLMSPLDVVQQPLRWLEAISRFRATTSGGPNFIYELCVQRIDPRLCCCLDLSSWQVAFNGAEPIRPETIDRFAEKFAPYGFRREAFFPCYGLAEATLFVSGGPKAVSPAIEKVRRTALESHRVAEVNGDTQDMVRVVGCGSPPATQHVAIVDPDSLMPCPEDRVGEIWVSGPSVARGYWNRPGETSRTFQAHIANNGDDRYLRTGDLGFVKAEQLFVTGRLKDLLIIDGRNYYPQDIEHSVEKCHPALRFHSGAALMKDEFQGLVIVQEVERNGRGVNSEEVLASIRQIVSEEHELSVDAIALVKTGGVPKTSSGKIRRRRCRELYLRGELPVIASWQQEEGTPPAQAGCTDCQRTSLQSAATASGCRTGLEGAEAIEAWLVSSISRRVHCEPCQIDVRRPFAWYGLQSRDALEISGELENRLRRRLPPTLLYDCPTVESLARYLAGEPRRRQSSELAVPPAPTLSLEPIALVGVGCRFPGAAGAAAFWKLLIEGADAIGEVPPDRWDAAAADRMLSAGLTHGNGVATVRWGGWLSGIDQFDAEFFGISPREAACIDPQQRLLMEVAWEALEDAGMPAERVRGSATGVYIGISTNDYRQAFVARTSEADPYWSTGNAGSIAANRLSYFLDLRGPSISIDTACSSSLVAVHLAMCSLRSGECDLALAGGVNAILSPDVSFSFAKGGGLASDGRCKAFDSRADGIVRSEGAGIVVLKRLSAAIADGDAIYAVIRGSAVNQDGRSNGITAPSQSAQEAVLQKAWASAGIPPQEAQYMETHGAGTLLGDVIEANALGTVLSPNSHPNRRCAIGSVKTNIGHCEAASGIAGVIKLALAIRHGIIPRSLHFNEPNPHIPFDEMPFFVQTETTPWPVESGRRLAGVSSFGFGGTNAHLVVESPPLLPTQSSADDDTDAVHLLPLSAATSAALRALADSLDEQLAAEPPQLVALCRTAALGRTHLDHRAALRFRTTEDLRRQLAALRGGHGHPAVWVGKKAGDRRPKVAFIFSGHGGQWRGMQRPLWDRVPAFSARIDECDRLIRQHAGWSLLTEFEVAEKASQTGHESIEVSQTSLFAIQVALAAAWKSWGIEPDAVAGHSVGEIAAACVAGALDLSDAVRVVVQRSRVLQQALYRMGDSTGMAALRVSDEEAEDLIEGLRERVWISVHNSPKYTVLSGDRAILEELVAGLRHRKIGARMMNVPGAAHTPLLEPAAAKLQAALDGLVCHDEVVPFYSTLLDPGENSRGLDARYWAESVCRPVRFASAVGSLVRDGVRSFLELGPHPILAAAVAQCLEPLEIDAVVEPSLRRGDTDLAAMLGSFGALYAAGVEVDWKRLYPNRGPRVVLPNYPWQRQRCWIAPLPARVTEPIPAKASGDGNGRNADLPGQARKADLPNEQVADDPAGEVLSISAALRLLDEVEPGRRREILEAYLQAQIAHTLGTHPSRIDVERSLTTMGIDSLMGIEIKNRVEAELGVDVSLVQFLEGPTVARLAGALLPQLDRHATSTELVKDQAVFGPSEGEIADQEALRLLEQFDQLSDDEVEALTRRMLAE